MLSLKLREQFYSQPALQSINQESHYLPWVHKQVTERDLVEDCLVLLCRGVSKYFEEDPVSNQFLPSKAIEVTHLSTGSLKRQLELVGQFHSNQHRIELKLKNIESYKGVVIKRLSNFIRQVQTEVSSEISYLQLIFGIQNGK